MFMVRRLCCRSSLMSVWVVLPERALAKQADRCSNEDKRLLVLGFCPEREERGVHTRSDLFQEGKVATSSSC